MATNNNTNNNNQNNNSNSITVNPSSSQSRQQQQQQQAAALQQIEQTAAPPKIDMDSLIQALQTLRSFEFSSIYVIAFLRYCVDFYLQHESRLVKIECVIKTSTLLCTRFTFTHINNIVCFEKTAHMCHH